MGRTCHWKPVVKDGAHEKVSAPLFRPHRIILCCVCAYLLPRSFRANTGREPEADARRIASPPGLAPVDGANSLAEEGLFSGPISEQAMARGHVRSHPKLSAVARATQARCPALDRRQQ